jgi:hypothetical protein
MIKEAGVRNRVPRLHDEHKGETPMKFLKLGINLALVFKGTLAMSAGRVIDDQEVPDLEQVEVADVTMAGTGCIDGGGASVHFDGEALIVEARELGAIAGDEHRRSDSRESCQFIIGMSVPEGWTYAVGQVSGGLNTALDSDTMAEADFATWFSATSEQGSASMPVYGRGRASEDFSLDMDTLVFAPCDGERSLKFKMALRVDLGDNVNAFAAADFEGPTRLGLQWKRCEG